MLINKQVSKSFEKIQNSKFKQVDLLFYKFIMKTYRISYKSSSDSIWKSGYVIVTPTDGWMWLKDDEKKTIRKGVISATLMNSIVSGTSDFIDLHCKYSYY